MACFDTAYSFAAPAHKGEILFRAMKNNLNQIINDSFQSLFSCYFKTDSGVALRTSSMYVHLMGLSLLRVDAP